ncbi:MAG: hypothetical protein Q8M91_02395, partial [Polaromonas sp.]|nr:hypothetical protein [Polaromonas sp.]
MKRCALQGLRIFIPALVFNPPPFCMRRGAQGQTDQGERLSEVLCFSSNLLGHQSRRIEHLVAFPDCECHAQQLAPQDQERLGAFKAIRTDGLLQRLEDSKRTRLNSRHSTVHTPLYQSSRAKGFASTEAFLILGRKVLRVAFAVWKGNEVFDPT